MTGVLAIVFLSLFIASFVATAAVDLSGGRKPSSIVIAVGLLKELTAIALCVSVLG